MLARLISESHHEIADSTRWKKPRFELDSGRESWRGPRTPIRIESHTKRFEMYLFETRMTLAHFLRRV